MKHLLLSLATTPERALRLLAFALDRLGPDCSDSMKVDVDGDGVITFSELRLPGANQEITPERRFASIRVWLEGSTAQPQLVEAFCQQGERSPLHRRRPICWWLIFASWRPWRSAGRESW